MILSNIIRYIQSYETNAIDSMRHKNFQLANHKTKKMYF